jgi:hypothetical protein
MHPATINQIEQYSTSILLQPVRTEGVTTALTGKQGTQIINDYRKITVVNPD